MTGAQAYQAAISSLQSNTNTLICFFGALLAFVGIVSAGFLWIIGVQSSKANEKMKKAEELSKEATSLISKAEEKHLRIISEQEKLDKSVQELKKLVDSKEVDEKLKEIGDIKRFVIQTKDRIYCEDALDRARRRFEILETSPDWNDFLVSDMDIYDKTLDLKARIDNAFTTLKASWMIFTQEQFAIQKNDSKRIMEEAMSLCDQLQVKFVTYLSDPKTQLRRAARLS
jgi:hypothetical protein